MVYASGTELYTRALDALEPTALGRSAWGRPQHPAFSPDGRWITFFDGIGLKKIAATGGPVPDIDYQGNPSGTKTDRNGNPVVSKLDPASLRLMAQAGGSQARYFEWGTSEPDIHEITGALATLKRGALQKKDERVMEELYHFFLFPGFMLLIIEACIGTRRRVKYPEAR